jgi:hypothetical protein
MKKIELELVISDDKKFINYWDYLHGNDVCCRIIDNKLILMGDEEKEIALEEFIKLIEIL